MMSEDLFLGGRLRLRQPVAGFRAAIDPVFLAASIEAKGGERVLELGAGTGIASLCLAVRQPGLVQVGLDLQPDLADLAQDNARLNGCADRVRFLAGDLRSPPPSFEAGGFDQVMANPPYLADGQATLPTDRARRLAVGESEARLADWIGVALRLVRPKGRITLIHRADRLDEILAALAGRAGEVVIFPLWPGAGKPAGRVLVRARAAVRTPMRLAPGLVLHEPGGAYTTAAQSILRDAEGLIL